MPRTLIGVSLGWQAVLLHLLQHSHSHRRIMEERCVQAGTTLDEWYRRCQVADYHESARTILHDLTTNHSQYEQLEVVPQQEPAATTYVIGLPLPMEMELDLLYTQLPQARQIFQAAQLTDTLSFYTMK
jgi:hypothetical protein